MIKKLLHTVVSRPTTYRWCQRTIGAGSITQRIAEHVPTGHSRVLDIGAGYGYARRFWPEEADYFLLDTDHAMLLRSHSTLAIQGDATRLPITNSSLDMVLCKQVSHHLPDEMLEALVSEVVRVLRPGGRFIFMDAVKTDSRVSRLLWHYDRGAHPRTKPELESHLKPRFKMVREEAAWHLHLYFLFLLEPIQSTCGLRPSDRPHREQQVQK